MVDKVIQKPMQRCYSILIILVCIHRITQYELGLKLDHIYEREVLMATVREHGRGLNRKVIRCVYCEPRQGMGA